MATYFYGASGECADCSNDDPCAPAICGDTTLVIDTDTSNVVVASCTLLDNDDASGYNYMIVAIDGTTDGLMAVQICDDGFNIGPKLSVNTGVSSTLCKTSESSTTFAYAELGGITLFSLNESTLEITATSSKTSYPATANFLLGCAFIAEGHLVLLSQGSNGNPIFDYNYYDVDVSLGTSISFGSPVISSPSNSYSGANLAFIGSSSCAAIETDSNGIIGVGEEVYLYTRVVSYSSGISLGSKTLIDTRSTNLNFTVHTNNSRAPSVTGKATFATSDPTSSGTLLLYVTNGSSFGVPLSITDATANFITSIGMNTGSLGIGFRWRAVTYKTFTFTISGYTPSAGTVTAVGSRGFVDAARETSGVLYDWPTGGITAELLT